MPHGFCLGLARYVLALALLEAILPSLASGAGGDPVRGSKLYRQYCQGCHGPDGRGAAHTFMPHVNTLTNKEHMAQVTDEYLFRMIAQGGEANGKSSYMPAWESKLDAQDIRDLIAHIRSLPKY